jgi:hypothetical protein
MWCALRNKGYSSQHEALAMCNEDKLGETKTEEMYRLQTEAESGDLQTRC